MENVKRTNGFIDLDELAKEPDFKSLLLNQFNLGTFNHSILSVFSYKGDIFFYKKEKALYKCYIELIGEELAKSFNLPVVHYDLAYTSRDGGGVISKNFKNNDNTYISGLEILKDYITNCLYQNKKLSYREKEDELMKQIVLKAFGPLLNTVI